MAKKAKKRSDKTSDENVVRIKASSTAKTTKSTKAEETVVTKAVTKTGNSHKQTKNKKVEDKAKPKAKRNKKGILKALAAIGSYFKGAWVELRQVRWPNRRATWSLTIAVLIYTAVFVALILLLDAGFKYLFDLMLGR